MADLQMGTTVKRASIIIPLFNSKDYIGTTLEFLTQFATKYDAEIIIVNDGSTDNSKIEVLKFSECVRLIDLAQNRGRSFARNRGIDAAKGEILIFLDADCLPRDEDFFTLHLSFHENLNGSLNGLVVFPPGFQSTTYLRFRGTEQTSLGLRSISADGLATGNVSLRREVAIRAGGFDETLHFCEDIDLGLRLEAPSFGFYADDRIVVYHMDKNIDLPRDMKRNYVAYAGSIKQILAKNPANRSKLPAIRLFEQHKRSYSYYFRHRYLPSLAYHCYGRLERFLPQRLAFKLMSFLTLSAAYDGFYGFNAKFFQRIQE
ncbi:MAG: glycosyltransferase family 2 protein [Chloroflexi bacterium]|nr:glycosyltransferase family 2 protein [Chloroflexota bacterium]